MTIRPSGSCVFLTQEKADRMARIGGIFVAAFLVISVVRVAADNGYLITQTVFLPPTFYVGDRVELRIRIETSAGVIPAEPDILPSASWLEIHSIDVVPVAGDYDILITFTSFYPGTRTLPTIQLGQISLDSMKIFTSSIIEETNADFSDVADPVLIPGTRLLLALFIGGLLVGPVLAIWLFRWVRILSKTLRALLLAKRPYKLFVRAIDMLRSADSGLKSREFYIALVDLFRKYVSQKMDLDIVASTATELSALLQQKLLTSPLSGNLSALLHEFDRAKFGGKRVTRARRERDIDEVVKAATALEDMFSGDKRHVDA